MTELASLTNPFRDNVVQDAWQSPKDVGEIHDGAFRACLRGIDAAGGGTPDSLLVYGSPGSGKTHLLTRLQRHLAETSPQAPDRVLRCVFVFVRLQTTPQLIWQHVRRRFAHDLMRREQDLTQLQRLIAHQLAIRTGESPRRGVIGVRVMRKEDQEALAQRLNALCTNLGLPRDLCSVLEHLMFDRSIRNAVAWLAGESLPEDALAELGLGPDVVEEREEAAREIVTALCRLAGKTLPIVFCFDQLEALQRTADDEEAFFRFGRMASDLYDADADVFLVTCLQSTILESFKKAVRQADFERIARRHCVLEPLTPDQARKLVLSRLGIDQELLELRARRPDAPFFPFSSEFVDRVATTPPCVPRRVLAACAREFEELQHGREGRRLEPEQFLARELEQRRTAARLEVQPADTTRLVTQGLQLLAGLDGNTISDRDPARADLVIDGRQKIAVSLRNEADGRSLGPRLKALLPHVPRKDGAALVIVRDPRLRVAKTAAKTREYLAELQARGARIVEPTVEALAALEALQSILADAKSGDLASDGEPIRDRTVLDWLKGLRDGLELEPVQELMDAIRGGSTEPALTADDQDLADLLAHEHVLELGLAAQILARTPELLLETARRSTERYLVLEGPPTLLLDVAGTTTASAGETED